MGRTPDGPITKEIKPTAAIAWKKIVHGEVKKGGKPMEFVTPEEISKTIIYEVKGGNTGHDIINALDNATMEPTYRAGFMQNYAVKKLEKLEKEHGTESVAFELLGPPRLSKLLHEINLLRHVANTMSKIVSSSATFLSEKIYLLLEKDEKLRSEIISIGIPILYPNGKLLLRGNIMKIPPYRGENELEITPENIDIGKVVSWIFIHEEHGLRMKA